jgi:hypothetical protein
MNGGKTSTLELALDFAASLVFAAASAFVAVEVKSVTAGVAGATIGFVASFALLRRVAAAEPAFTMPQFALQHADVDEADELLLTDEYHADELLLSDADRLREGNAELVLDDVLAELDNHSRVVRLFDRAAMPTPGELSDRIDRHLEREPAAAPDASQALHDALAELRRSLR